MPAMLDDRKAAILHALVREYIETAQPVGSGRITDSPGVEVSSATVRSEMASLEQQDYLTQPHTSAGRVPTAKGYRFFVDRVCDQAPVLDPADRRQVCEFFSAASGEMSVVLSHTARLLSDLTDWTGVVVSSNPATATVRSVQLIDVATCRVMVLAVMSNGTVEKRVFDAADGTTPEVVADASRRLADRVVGCTLAELAEIGDVVGVMAGDTSAGEVGEMFDPLLAAALEALARLLRGALRHHEMFVGGTDKLAAAFNAVEQLCGVLRLLEQQFVVATLMREVIDSGDRVAIGAEIGLSPLSECSLVLAPYSAPGTGSGAIGVLGPTRMDYPQALSAVTVVSEQLSAALGDG